MKQLILWSALTCLGATPAMAQSCTPAPSCSALGYTQTATACNTLGLSYIVCPFDSSKVFCGNAASVGPSIGDLKYSLRSSNHDGWLLCDGTQYSQTTYPELKSVIGTNFCHKYTSRTDISYYSSNCKSGYFAVPDYRGFLLKGVFSSNSSSNTVGAYNNYNSYAIFYKGNYMPSNITTYSVPYIPQHEQLPNIKGEVALLGPNYSSSYGKAGALSITRSGMNWGDGSGKNTASAGIAFNAASSSSIYDGEHVSPDSYGAYIFIYAGK